RVRAGEVRGSQAPRSGAPPGEGVPPGPGQDRGDADRDGGEDVRSAVPRRRGDGSGRHAARGSPARLALRRQGPPGGVGAPGEAEGIGSVTGELTGTGSSAIRVPSIFTWRFHG